MLHTERARFARGEFAGASRIIRISRRGNGHVPGKIHRVVKTHARACFEIRGNQQRILRQLLHPIDENDGFVNRPAKQDDSADVVIDNLMTQRFESLTVLIQKRGIDAD